MMIALYQKGRGGFMIKNFEKVAVNSLKLLL